MTVAIPPSHLHTTYNGRNFSCCCHPYKQLFERNPQHYLVQNKRTTPGRERDFAGTHIIDAPLIQVRSYLFHVHNLAACAPGFQSLEEGEPTHGQAVMSVGVGPVQATFTLDVTHPEMQELERMTRKGRRTPPRSTVELSASMHRSVKRPS